MLIINIIVNLESAALSAACHCPLNIFGADMQDDNLQNMEYLLTKEAFDNWVAGTTADDLDDYFRDTSAVSITDYYLKEHGLPLDSLIKE